MKRIRLVLIVSAVIMALAMAVNAASLTSAKPFDTVEAGKLNIVIDGGTELKTARPGDTVDVKINLVNNTTISSLYAKVTWPEKLQLIKAEYNIINENDKSVMVNEPDEKDGKPDWGSVKGVFVFNWITALREVKGDCTFVTMTFKVAEDAADGDYCEIKAEVDPENVFDIDGKNIDYKLINGGVSISDTASTQEGVTTTASGETETEKKPNTALIIVIIVAVVAIAAAVAAVIISKKKKK